MSVPNSSVSPLRHEEEREGSILLSLNVKLVVMIIGPLFQLLPIGCRWSLDHQDCQKTVLGFFLLGVLLNRWWSLPISLGNSSQQLATLGFLWYSSQ